MFHETYLANKVVWQNARDLGSHIEFVTSTARSPLAPPQDLLDDWNRTTKNLSSWREINYEARYREYLSKSDSARKRLLKLKSIEGSGQDVYLVCYERNFPCPRFILLDILSNKQT